MSEPTRQTRLACLITRTLQHEFSGDWWVHGTMDAGIAQENGGLQNITLTVLPGEVLVVPQGLLHFNHNNKCAALVFLQTFNNGDPGAVNVINALAALKGDALI
ncbi:hypothetical protein WJX72_012205 [[Myrmecia] bisecta]|uniref:Germin-like protein n=1 Tax=[Myrmecia] bisecta TaxID=41462 RepID=A0AAW1PHA2_9CHLO